ncbi:DUF3422 family protein [Phenylobacterium deserti]|uniref:DUF3422 domain-containing protein n=1 Tax=Phenylobacterium deserti TaxID=1914756 RepID=A0A328AQW6_9CAUL|nr:DUF3422 domain-containing protein [Phenylobacterium deserti]RAK57410.1 DUF3422 domain-containing protein [Phenylobacterium deserti]
MSEQSINGLAVHPLRARVLEEIHARPFAAIAAPCRVLHFAFLSDGGEDEREALGAWLGAWLGADGPGDEARHFQATVGGRTFQWERHGEFTAYTFELAAGAPPLWPAGLPQPGLLLVAVQLDLGAPEELALAGGGARTALADGRALAASSFRPNADGFVEIGVTDRGLVEGEAGPLIQRILEVETYRTLALLGLPEAQRHGPTIRRIETELPGVIEAIRTGDLQESQALLDRLSELSADLEAGSAAAAYRFGATRAYAELMRLRLEALHESAVDGAPTWSAFFARRLNPAMRTCLSTEERQSNLSRKLTRAAQLLRTKVEVTLQSQNRDLLRAMNRRARLQLQLQQTVEGLSVAAISYYVASLAHLGLEGAHAIWPWIDPNVGTAIAVPFIIAAVWLTVARVRKAHKPEG